MTGETAVALGGPEMAGRVELTVSGDCAELSPNRRLHPLDRSRIVRRWREKAKLLYQSGGHPAFGRRVRISFLIRRGRRLDQAQIHGTGALKAVEDGLVDAGMVPNDTEDWVIWGEVKQQCGPEWRHQPELVVVIEETEE